MEKIIHCCWLNNQPKTELATFCQASWVEKMPDYKIVEWTVDNFDVNTNEYCKQAFGRHAFDFVSDYIRLFALYEFGGIFLDYNVEVRKDLTPLLDDFEMFSAINESDIDMMKAMIPFNPQVIGCEPYHPMFKQLIEQYDSIDFINDGKADETTLSQRIKKYIDRDYSLLTSYKGYEIPKIGLKVYPMKTLGEDSEEAYAVIHDEMPGVETEEAEE